MILITEITVPQAENEMQNFDILLKKITLSFVKCNVLLNTSKPSKNDKSISFDRVNKTSNKYENQPKHWILHFSIYDHTVIIRFIKAEKYTIYKFAFKSC